MGPYSPLGVRDDSDGRQQLADGVDEILVCRRDALDTCRCDGRHCQVIQVRVELQQHVAIITPVVVSVI